MSIQYISTEHVPDLKGVHAFSLRSCIIRIGQHHYMRLFHIRKTSACCCFYIWWLTLNMSQKLYLFSRTTMFFR